MRVRLARLLRRWPALRVVVPTVLVTVLLTAAFGYVAIQLGRTSATTPRPVLVSSGSWAPFVGPDLPEGGPLTELVTEVLRAQGYTPEVGFTSWPLAEKRAVAGETIGAFPLVGSESRRAELLLSEPLVEFQYVLFYDRSRGEPLVRTAADLAGLRVGRIAGYDYWPELEDAVPGFVEYPTSAVAFRALAAGEIDLLPEGLLSGRAVLDDPRFDPDPARFGHVPGDDPLVRSTEGLYFVMPRTAEAAAVMRDFDAGLAALKEQETYTRIVSGLTEGGADVEVLLEPVEDADLVELFAADGTPALVAPRGTRARVLSWPAPFVSVPGEDTEGLLVPVKLLNGPAQGRVLQVDARALALPGSD